jgi:single-stranded-DNA-specific exonuclease
MLDRASAERRWVVARPAAEAEGRLVAELGVSALLARLLVNRGLGDAGRAEAFLAPRLADHLRSPMLFRDMGRAAERLRAALAAGDRIGIYGDYDADGISGSAILIRLLRALGCEPLLHVPHRLREGYGLSEPGVRRLAEAGARVIITVDCGAVGHREIALARSLGVDVIVCDHHQVSGTPLPAHAVLNPIEPDGGFPFQGLCGAGVAFYLAMGLRMRLREAGVAPLPDLRRYLDLVTLGTVADVVPIVEENRVLVKHGLREIGASTRPGIVALKAVGGVDEVTTAAVGFRLTPRLNAGGRLADAARSVELLTTDDRGVADRLAAELDEENRTRQGIEREILRGAEEMIEEAGGVGARRSIVLASPEWHPGVIGIVASRLVERHFRPTLLIALEAERGLARGSGRSIPGLDLFAVVGACREWLEGYGGHRMAVGLTIRPDRIPPFAEAIEAAVAERAEAHHFLRTERVDCALDLDELTEGCVDELERLEPHGPGNASPVFFGRGLSVLSSRVVGNGHLKLFLAQNEVRFSAIGFGMGGRAIEPGELVDVLYRPVINDYNGTRSLELKLQDLRPHRAASV